MTLSTRASHPRRDNIANDKVGVVINSQDILDNFRTHFELKVAQSSEKRRGFGDNTT